jgi:hypothetical protein
MGTWRAKPSMFASMFSVQGESEPAVRGIEIHQVLASYINHLVRTRRARDLELFDALMRGASAEAREGLEKF